MLSSVAVLGSGTVPPPPGPVVASHPFVSMETVLEVFEARLPRSSKGCARFIP